MPVKQHQVNKNVRKLNNRGTAYWYLLLAIILSIIGLALNLHPAWAELTPGAVAVDDKVKVSFSGLRLNRSTNTFDSLATLTNQSTVPIDIPVQLAITTISLSTVTLTNATGIQTNGAPYVNVTVSDGVLDPGESVSNILLKFNNPQKTAFTFKHSVFGVLPEVNHPPVANAGGDQSVPVGTEVTLNGVNSTDEDGDALTYRWRIVSQPSGTPSQLDNATAIAPKLLITRKGTYQIELIVNDGQVDSQPAQVGITTENSKPVAAAGDDQTVFVKQTAQLDGVNSKDIDEDMITFIWQLIAKPTGSQATLQNETTQTPSLTPDKTGDYTVQLIVNDGLLNSDPDRVIISTQNSKPIADAGPNQQGTVGHPVILDGQLSKDVDDDPLSFVWSVLNKPTNSNPVLQNMDQAKATLIPDLPGDYVSQLIVNDGHVSSDPDTALVTVSVAPPVNNPPQISSSPVLTATVGQNYSYDVDATDSDNDTLTYSLSTFPNGMAINTQTGLIEWTPVASQTGPQSVTVNVNDNKGGSDSQSFTVTAAATGQITVPDVRNLSRAAAETAIQQAKLTLGTLSFEHNAIADGSVINQSPAANSSVVEGAKVNLTISLGLDQNLPPNPETVASRLDSMVVTTTFAATEFLYSGPNPIQTGVQPGTIEAKRAAVIRGKVLDKQNNPLSGVTITILNHPELGQTQSRADGQFDLAVNGGGYLTVSYQKTDYLPAQRQVNAPWQDYVPVDDVVLIQLDSQVTEVNLTNTTTLQVARGNPVTDADGTRQATLLFPAGTQATMTLPDGNTQPLSALHIRATEYTVGANGPHAMPGALPPSSGYTYAVELSADEAITAGATRVNFSQPVPFYVENFVGFPVGSLVPTGFYDRLKGQWVASVNGQVIKVLGATGGLADLDLDGDGNVDDAAALAALGITDAERQRLGILYAAGQSLWRVLIPHFSPWDHNWPYGPPPGSEPPGSSGDPKPGPKPPKPPKDPGTTCGSIIGCEPQTLGEVIDVTGAPLSLRYQSDRVPGRRDTNKLKIRLSGATLPPGLARIHLEIAIAGQTFKNNFASQPNLIDTFTWDGKDVYGRPVRGQQPVKVRIGYQYSAQYYTTQASFAASFNSFGSPPSGVSRGGNGGGGGGSSSVDILSFDSSRTIPSPIILWQDYEASLGVFDSSEAGGWSLSIHHAYDVRNRTLYLGNGDKRSATDVGLDIITTVAGTGTQQGFAGDGGQATQALLGRPQGVAVGPDGSLYIADILNNRVRKVDSDGIITTMAGTGSPFFAGDGGPATQSSMNPAGVAVGPDGSLYIADILNSRVRKVGLDGVITTVAGTGGFGFAGDDGPATQAQFNPQGFIAVGSDDSLYISDAGRVRRVGPDGIITTIAGTGVNGFSGDGGLATLAEIAPRGVAVAPDGSLYIADATRRVRKVATDGIITTVAGTGDFGFAGDGGPAIQAQLNTPRGIAVGPDGILYIADSGNNNVRRVGPDGILTTIAGTRVDGFSGDGGPATQADLNDPVGVAVGFDGSVYIVDALNNRIRQLGSALPGSSVGDISIAAEDGSEIYVFTGGGRHLRTLDALTGAVRYQFTYDSAGRLATITDGDGNVTSIERDGGGNPTAIVAPFGQRTTLAVDGDGYLTRVTNPAGDAVQLTYDTGDAEGLLATMTDPRGNVHRYLYDTLGRLVRDENPAGGVKTLTRTDLTDDLYAVAVTTALGQVTNYEVEELPTGGTRRVRTEPSGIRTQSLYGTDGSRKTTFADGTIVNLLQGPDPRWSMQTPVSKSVSTTKGGLTSTLTTDRQAELADANNPLSLNRLTDTVTLNGRIYKSVFDKATQTTSNTTPSGRFSTAVTDSLGRVTQTHVPGFLAVNSAYDAKGRLSRIVQGTEADERVVDFAYNAQGYLASVTDPLGRSVGMEYDAAGRITRQTQPDGRVILYDYDANGNLASLSPPGRPAHVFHYTPVNLTQDYQPPAVNANNNTVYDYDVDKHLTKITRPDAQTLNFTYDSAGRRSILDTPDGAISYAYNSVTGELTGITDTAGGMLNFTYSGGLLTQTAWTGVVSGSVGRTYDNDFRVTSLNVNGANAIAFQYDADSLLTQAGGLNLSRNVQNGVLTGTMLGNVTDSLSYDGFGAVTDYTAKISAASAFSTQFTRDKLGRITRKVETFGGVVHTYDYGYDLAGRLEQVKQDGIVTAGYTYDSNGNRLTGPNALNAATYDDQDRLLIFAGSTYDYTANGELKTKTTGVAITRYDYDVLGNLKHVTLPDGTAIDYVIDGQNRRIGKKVGGVLVQGFLYQDQLKPIAELDADGNVVSRFVYATDINVPDYMIKGGQTYRIITDHLGSPRLVVDTTTGTIAQRMAYDEFGNVLIDTNPGFQPFGFAGGLYDRDTTLVRFGARDYEAETGRWTAKDSSQFAGGANLFGYSFNDPVNYFDQNGQNPALVAGGAVVAGGIILEAAAWTGIGFITVDCAFNGCQGTVALSNTIADLVNPKDDGVGDKCPTFGPTGKDGEVSPNGDTDLPERPLYDRDPTDIPGAGNPRNPQFPKDFPYREPKIPYPNTPEGGFPELPPGGTFD